MPEQGDVVLIPKFGLLPDFLVAQKVRFFESTGLLPGSEAVVKGALISPTRTWAACAI